MARARSAPAGFPTLSWASVTLITRRSISARDPPPAIPAPPPWDRLDEEVRVAALEILARLIARMLTAKQPQETSND
jgi:hypothetical protein